MRCFAAGISTSSSISSARFIAASRFIPRWSAAASAIWSPTVNTGLRLVIGSWKIMAMSRPRNLRSAFAGSLARSTTGPSRVRNRISPPTMRPGGFGISPMIDRLVTDLPEPDSPTTASVSPASSVNETSSTALTRPASVKKCVWRCPTRSSVTGASAEVATITSPCAALDRAGRENRRRPSAATAPKG